MDFEERIDGAIDAIATARDNLERAVDQSAENRAIVHDEFTHVNVGELSIYLKAYTDAVNDFRTVVGDQTSTLMDLLKKYCAPYCPQPFEDGAGRNYCNARGCA